MSFTANTFKKQFEVYSDAELLEKVDSDRLLKPGKGFANSDLSYIVLSGLAGAVLGIYFAKLSETSIAVTPILVSLAAMVVCFLIMKLVGSPGHKKYVESLIEAGHIEMLSRVNAILSKNGYRLVQDYYMNVYNALRGKEVEVWDADHNLQVVKLSDLSFDSK